MKLRICFIVAFLFSAPVFSENFVATIKPIHSLLQSILGDTENAVLLIDNNASPHNYQLKPSNIKTLTQAELIVFIDPSFEVFMEKLSSSIGQNVELIELAHQGNLELLEPRKYDTNNDSSEHDTHDHGLIDPHLWLNPNNARAIVTLLAEKLSVLKPENKSIYQQNLKKTIDKLDNLENQLLHQLKPLSKSQFIVQHDAYYYFEKYYGLESISALALDAAIPPSVKLVQNISDSIEENNVVCIFYEPQFSAKLVKAIAADTNIKTTELDPIGQDINPGSDLYFELMSQLGNNFEKCLRQAP